MSVVTITYTVVPNIGSVVNQGQGFRIKATIQNNTAFNLNDVLLQSTVVPAGITPDAESVEVGTIPANGSVTVSMGFDTDSNIAVGAHGVGMKCEGVVYGNKWTVVIPAPPAAKPIGVADLYPTFSDSQNVTVNIVQE